MCYHFIDDTSRRLSAQTSPGRRAISMPRATQQNYLEPPRPVSPETVDSLKRSARRRPQSKFHVTPEITKVI